MKIETRISARFLKGWTIRQSKHGWYDLYPKQGMKQTVNVFGKCYGTGNVYFSADFHYNHSALVRGTSKWEDKAPCRNFDTLEEHDYTLVKNINDLVKEDDILISLGDWNFGDYKSGSNITNARKFREQLNVKTIIHCLGNHDVHVRQNKDNSQELFSWVGDYLELEIIENTKEQGVKPHKQKIVCSHYPISSWNHQRHGSFMLFGHTHSSYKGAKGKSMDVGIDCHLEFRPFSYWEVKEIMNKKEIVIVDHHN
jgi:calcineurin-like phosphoesterase family protein